MKRESPQNLKEGIKKIKKEHPFFKTSMNQSSIHWITTHDSVLIAKSKIDKLEKHKVAAFDLDGTLITTKSGRVFPKDEHDWRWWNPNVPKRLEVLNQEGYEIVIFSNQNGLNNDNKIKGFQYKIETILKQIESPILFMAAMKKDRFRKPLTGMWDWFVNESTAEQIDKSSSFYVGDAAGRQDGWKLKLKKDHSCGDRKFADNLHIGFHTPEEFFLSEPKAPFQWGGFNPKEHLKKTLPPYVEETKDHPEVIVCVGLPACGKSSFVKRHLIPKGYVHVNQDTLKTKEKCLLACKQALAKKQSVVIDNTNVDAVTRKFYIQLAKEANVPIRCFYFGNNQDLAQHNSYYRAIHKPEEKREIISSIVYRTLKSKFQEPKESEGFDEVKTIHFVFEGSDSDKEVWQKWWF